VTTGKLLKTQGGLQHSIGVILSSAGWCRSVH